MPLRNIPRRTLNGVADLASYMLASAVDTLRTLPFARYLASRPVVADTYFASLMINQRGDLATQEQYAPDAEDNANDVIWGAQRALSSSTGSWLNYTSGAAMLVGTAGLSVKTTAGRLRSVGAVNTSATVDLYLVGVNKASAAVNGDATVFSVPIEDITANFAGSGNGIDFGPDGLYLSAGISLAVSTTPHLVTLPAAASCHVFARYL